MPKPGPITVDLSEVYAAIDAVKQSLTSELAVLADIQARLTKLETPPPSPLPLPTPTLTPAPVESPAFLAALAQFHTLRIDNTVSDANGNGSYGGGYWGAQIMAGDNNATTGGMVYYDGVRVYYQIADAVDDPATWNPVAKKAVTIYRDWYVLAQPEPGKVAGNQIFAKGLYMDWLRTGDPLSKQAVLDLATKGAFEDTPFPAWLPGPGTMREVAYDLEARMYANDLGGTFDLTFHLERLKLYCAQTLAMLNGQAPPAPDPLNPNPLKPVDLIVRPFMVGLGCEALIEYWMRTQDATILPLLQPVLEALWRVAITPTGDSMYYTACAQGASGSGSAPNVVSNDGGDGTPTTPAPVLNLLIAPAYWWVYSQTKDITWRNRGDALFIGCMTACCKTGLLQYNGGKDFNQVFKWTGPEVWQWRNG